MAKFLRTILFSLLILGVLVYLSILHYFSPGQVRGRISAALSPYLATAPEIYEVHQGILSPLTIERLEIPAAPVIHQRELLILHRLRIEGSGSEGWIPANPGGTNGLQGLSIQIHQGELKLDLKRVSGPPGSLSSTPVWNFQDLLRGTGAIRNAVEDAIRNDYRIETGRLDLFLQEVRQQEKAAWAARMEDLVVERSSPSCLEVRGRLLPFPGWPQHWSEGQFKVLLRPPSTGRDLSLEAMGSLDNLQGVDEWLFFFFPTYRRLVSLLNPSGPVTFHLDSLRYDPGAGGPSGEDRKGAPLEFQAHLRHYDGTLRIAPWGLEVRHLNGRIGIGPEGISFGGQDIRGRLAGEVWGNEVDLSGRLDSRESWVRLGVPSTEIRSAALSAMPQDLAEAWKWLRPQGVLSGSLAARISPKEEVEWDIDLSFRSLAFAELPFLGPAAGRIFLQVRSGTGSGSLDLESAGLGPFGDLKGSIPVAWTGGGLKAGAAGLSLGQGSLSAEVEHLIPQGRLGIVLRIDQAPVQPSGGLFEAARSSGRVEISLSGGVLSGEGRISLEAVRLRKDLLPEPAQDAGAPEGERRPAAPAEGGTSGPEESIAFREGQVRFGIVAEGFQPLQISLRGDGSGLRLLGKIGFRGEIEAVAVFAVGDPARGLNLLKDESPPWEWRKATGGQAVALRLAGESLRPRIRRVEWSDTAFFQQGPGEGKEKPR